MLTSKFPRAGLAVAALAGRGAEATNGPGTECAVVRDFHSRIFAPEDCSGFFGYSGTTCWWGVCPTNSSAGP